MQSALKILFVDDHEGLRDGVSFLLNKENSNLHFVNAANCEQAQKALTENSDINLALFDINLDGENGIELITILRKIRPQLLVIVYSMYSDALHIEMALKANIQGYVTKDAKIEELKKAIFTVNEGGMYYNKRSSQMLHNLISKDTAVVDEEFSASLSLIEGYKTLTKKEQEIFMLLAKNMTTEEIAATLKKAEKTVINQRTIIYSKLNLKDRLDLQNAARTLGVIV